MIFEIETWNLAQRCRTTKRRTNHEGEAEFINQVREASEIRQKETAKARKKQLAKSEKRHAELF